MKNGAVKARKYFMQSALLFEAMAQRDGPTMWRSWQEVWDRGGEWREALRLGTHAGRMQWSDVVLF